MLFKYQFSVEAAVGKTCANQAKPSTSLSAASCHSAKPLPPDPQSQTAAESPVPCKTSSHVVPAPHTMSLAKCTRHTHHYLPSKDIPHCLSSYLIWASWHQTWWAWSSLWSWDLFTHLFCTKRHEGKGGGGNVSHVAGLSAGFFATESGFRHLNGHACICRTTNRNGSLWNDVDS